MSERAAPTAAGARGGGRPDLDAPAALMVGLIGTIAGLALVVALQALYNRTVQAVFEQKVVSEAPEELKQLRAEQLGVLNGYRWVDAKAGVVAIPIDRAMDLLVREHRSRAAAAESAGKP